jgi:anti-sigma-K factor RskA
MMDERQEEFASLHALDMLEGAERDAFEARLRAEPELARRVRDLREAAAALSLAAPQREPPAGLKDRVLASAEAASRARPGPAGGAAPTPFARMIPWAIAAGLALCSAWLGFGYLSSRSENALLRDQRKLADMELQGARNQLEAERIVNGRELADTRGQLADARQGLASANREIAGLHQAVKDAGNLNQYRISTLASLGGNTPEALAVAVWCPSMQEGILAVSKLPALPPDKDYQLWVIDAQYKGPVDAGVFAIDPATGGARTIFKASKPIRTVQKFAISRERKGGARNAPEGPIVLVSE